MSEKVIHKEKDVSKEDLAKKRAEKARTKARRAARRRVKRDEDYSKTVMEQSNEVDRYWTQRPKNR